MSIEFAPTWQGQDGLEGFDEDRFREEFRQLNTDRLFFDAHKSSLYEQFHGMYVAIYRENLVAVAETMEGLINRLDTIGIRPGAAYWQFLPSERTVLVPSSWHFQD